MSLKNNFLHFDQFVIRIPLLPFDRIMDLERAVGQESTVLNTFLQDPIIQEALFIESPDLHQACKGWLLGQQQDQKK